MRNKVNVKTSKTIAKKKLSFALFRSEAKYFILRNLCTLNPRGFKGLNSEIKGSMDRYWSHYVAGQEFIFIFKGTPS